MTTANIPSGAAPAGAPAAEAWAGVDVGGRRKGFHAALLTAAGSLEGLVRCPTPEAVIAWLQPRAPRLVAVDGPRRLAPDGERSRADERRLARTVCALRYTPDRRRLAASPAYYEWITHGLELYAALEAAGLAAIECFPTASWTRWAGPRGHRSRAAWSGRALRRLGLRGLPRLLEQDGRDAIAAAVTARQHARGRTELFGDIAVPRVPGRGVHRKELTTEGRPSSSRTYGGRHGPEVDVSPPPRRVPVRPAGSPRADAPAPPSRARQEGCSGTTLHHPPPDTPAPASGRHDPGLADPARAPGQPSCDRAAVQES